MSKHSEKIEKAEAQGVRVVTQIVREWWKCRFQEFDVRNDDGVDGIVFLKKNGVTTGEVVQCQIKSGSGYKSNTDYGDKIAIKLGKKYINNHRPRWNSIISPVILVFVDDAVDENNMNFAWWVNLKAETT